MKNLIAIIIVLIAIGICSLIPKSNHARSMSLNNIRTDNAQTFDTGKRVANIWFVEQTSEPVIVAAQFK